MIPVKRKATGAEIQKLFRHRMASQGLVRKDAWILPEHALVLFAVTKALQKPGTRILIQEGPTTMAQKIENAQSLRDHLATQFAGKPVEVTLIQGVDPVIQLKLGDHGDLAVAVSGQRGGGWRRD